MYNHKRKRGWCESLSYSQLHHNHNKIITEQAYAEYTTLTEELSRIDFT